MPQKLSRMLYKNRLIVGRDWQQMDYIENKKCIFDIVAHYCPVKDRINSIGY